MKGLDYKEKQEGSITSNNKGSKYRKTWVLLLAASLLLISFSGLPFISQFDHCGLNKDVIQFIDSYNGVDDKEKQEPLEVFELTLPIFFKNPVYEENLLVHSFGNSWGKPAISTFKPPRDIEFNRVVLNLNMSVDGVQYDRLAHIFIDDIPIWRTSTPEPGNQLVYSDVSKDISKYLPLFKGKDELVVVLQLDNLIVGKLTGVFNTSLSVTYYNEDLDNEDDEVGSLFKVTNRPSHRISRLIERKPNRTPLVYYPDQPLVFNLPTVAQNTTHLKLALYVSGNAGEEFWYTNVLDEFKDKFASKGRQFLGHGPVRTVKIYINDILISTAAPEPVIYSGGISPALWRPIIGINAFDIKPLEIDISGFLPELWSNTGARLRVEITNGQDEEPLRIGENWIASANLLHWESPKIESSIGEILGYSNSSYFKGSGLSENIDDLYQTVFANSSVDFYSNITINLYNGTQVPLKVHTNSIAAYSNFQQYSAYGDVEFVSSLVSSSVNSIVYLINDEGKSVKLNSLGAHKVHPQVISLATQPIDVSRNVSFDVNITTVYGSNVKLDQKEVFSLESYHKGTSRYVLSPVGNHGWGSAYQNFVADLKFPFPKLKVDELVEAVNGTVTRRESGDVNKKAVEIDSMSSNPSLDAFKEHLRYLSDESMISDSALKSFTDAIISSGESFKDNTERNFINKLENEIIGDLEENGVVNTRLNIGSRLLV